MVNLNVNRDRLLNLLRPVNILKSNRHKENIDTRTV